MLTVLKAYIKTALIPMLYVFGILVSFKTIFKDVRWGFFLLVFLIPQSNVWYKLHPYPFGKDFLDILFLAVLLGLFIQKKGIEGVSNTGLIICYILFSYLTLINSSFQFGLPFPVTTDNGLLISWKNYAQMLFLYILASNVIREEDQQKVLIVLMAIVVLIVAVRAFRDFSGGATFRYDKRYAGPFAVSRLGANHFGAFMSYNFALLLGMFFIDKQKKEIYSFSPLSYFHFILYFLHIHGEFI